MDNLISHFKKQTKDVIKNIYCITFTSGTTQFFNILVICFTLDEAIPTAKATAVAKLGAVENTLVFKNYLILAGDEVLKSILNMEEINEKGMTKTEANKLMKELIKNKDKAAVEKSELSIAQKKYVLGEMEK